MLHTLAILGAVAWVAIVLWGITGMDRRLSR